jgi:ABC-type glycerol-3-phosphate transport system substrate-binding protein
MRRYGALCAIALSVVLVGSCTGDSGDDNANLESSGSHEPVTITLQDYYGASTPIKSVIKDFEKEYPWITVKYEAVDWDTLHEKFTVQVSSGDAPDVATLDMTWIPTFASNGLLASLSDISGGQMNGQPITDQYTEGGIEAMTYNDEIVTMLFDFDVYALFYRTDVFKKKGVDVPTTWDEWTVAADKIAEDTDGDGACDKYCLEVDDETFHWSQILLQNGGSILTDDNSQAAFNSPEGVEAVDFYKSFVDDGTGIVWDASQGDRQNGLKDERIAMFTDGPYYMGIMKSGAPEMSGKWGVAEAPYSQEPGSYLGGTGLSIPVNAEHPQEAWEFIQFMMRPENATKIFTIAGAAPGLTAALQSDEVNQPDPYFSDQNTLPVFLDAMSTATHFPYVAQWDSIQTMIDQGLEAAFLEKATPQEALDGAASKVNDELGS